MRNKRGYSEEHTGDILRNKRGYTEEHRHPGNPYFMRVVANEKKLKLSKTV